MYLTQSEMEIMHAFWQEDRSMSLNDLILASPDRCWKDRSGFSIINSLITKGLLKEDGYVHSGKTIARTFSPVISYTDFMIGQLNSFEGKIAVPQLVSHLLGEGDVDARDIKELDRMISDKKKELKDK